MTPFGVLVLVKQNNESEVFCIWFARNENFLVYSAINLTDVGEGAVKGHFMTVVPPVKKL